MGKRVLEKLFFFLFKKKKNSTKELFSSSKINAREKTSRGARAAWFTDFLFAVTVCYYSRAAGGKKKGKEKKKTEVEKKKVSAQISGRFAKVELES